MLRFAECIVYDNVSEGKGSRWRGYTFGGAMGSTMRVADLLDLERNKENKMIVN